MGLTNLEDPYDGLASGSIVFLIVLICAVAVVAVAFRSKQTCYAVNFTAILIVMAFIMWACTYMCQMFPLVKPEYSGTE
jgi:UDP-N-acetylmuramyl pentapeptide phosphotransferase/UDP-N-acetylglucosamine-1-phosphate transferase